MPKIFKAKPQLNIYKSLLDHYANNQTLKTHVLFMKDTMYLPPRFDHSRDFKNVSPTKFIDLAHEFGMSEEGHDGAAFIYPNGDVLFGGIIDAQKLIPEMPKSINAYGTAGALMRLLTRPGNSYVQRALKCGDGLALYYRGKKRYLVKPNKHTQPDLHNYGMGMFFSDQLPESSDLRLVSLANYRVHKNIDSVHKLAKKVIDVCFNRYHHDGFWHVNTYENTFSGPYLILPKITDEYIAGTGGMKRLTAKLLSYLHNMHAIILRENSYNIFSYLTDYGERVTKLQEALNFHFALYEDIRRKRR